MLRTEISLVLLSRSDRQEIRQVFSPPPPHPPKNRTFDCPSLQGSKSCRTDASTPHTYYVMCTYNLHHAVIQHVCLLCFNIRINQIFTLRASLTIFIVILVFMWYVCNPFCNKQSIVTMSMLKKIKFVPNDADHKKTLINFVSAIFIFLEHCLIPMFKFPSFKAL